MDYTKSATIMQTKFITEWNNLLETFNQVLFSIPNTDSTRVFILLTNKINSNCRAAINLIEQGFINEGLMIFRSAIETVIYAKYLKLYPEEQEKFLQLSDLFAVKNLFIQYKKIRNDQSVKPYELLILQKTLENQIRELLNISEFLKKDDAYLVPISLLLAIFEYDNTDKNSIDAEYALGGLSNNLFASKYVLYMPDKEQLIAEVEKVLDNWHKEEK